jgi:hypothetical protein
VVAATVTKSYVTAYRSISCISGHLSPDMPSLNRSIKSRSRDGRHYSTVRIGWRSSARARLRRPLARDRPIRPADEPVASRRSSLSPWEAPKRTRTTGRGSPGPTRVRTCRKPSSRPNGIRSASSVTRTFDPADRIGPVGWVVSDPTLSLSTVGRSGSVPVVASAVRSRSPGRRSGGRAGSVDEGRDVGGCRSWRSDRIPERSDKE